MNQKRLTWKSWNPEEVCDKIEDVCRSFGFYPKWEDFDGVRTFGNLCDVICRRIRTQRAERNASLEVFLKLRLEIGGLRNIDPNSISPDSRLDDLLPRRGRRGQVKLLQQRLGFRLKLLRPRHWLTTTLIWCIIASPVLFAFCWQAGLTGLLSGLFAYDLARRYGNEFCYVNLGDLALALIRKNYVSARRDPDAVDPKEIVPLIEAAFRRELLLAPGELRRDVRIY
jgi:hypothetical protein